MNRREFLKTSLTLGVLGSVAKLCPAFAGLDVPVRSQTSGRAKSVIELWIWGGPCQLDAFDPKPDLPRNYTGGRRALPTSVDGLLVSEYMPELAKKAKLYSVIRSMSHPFL